MKCNNCGFESTEDLNICSFCGMELSQEELTTLPMIQVSKRTTLLFFVPLAILLIELLLSAVGQTPATFLGIATRFLSILSIIALWLSLNYEYKLIPYHNVRQFLFFIFGGFNIVGLIVSTIYLYKLNTQGVGSMTPTQIMTFFSIIQLFSILNYLLLIIPLTMIFVIKPRYHYVSILWSFYLLFPIHFLITRVLFFIFQGNMPFIVGINRVNQFLSYVPIVLFAIIGLIRLKETKQDS